MFVPLLCSQFPYRKECHSVYLQSKKGVLTASCHHFMFSFFLLILWLCMSLFAISLSLFFHFSFFINGPGKWMLLRINICGVLVFWDLKEIIRATLNTYFLILKNVIKTLPFLSWKIMLTALTTHELYHKNTNNILDKSEEIKKNV